MCFTLSSFAQVEEKTELKFSKVIEASGLTKAQIYASVRAWVAEYYVSAKEVIQMDDKDEGVLIIAPEMIYKTGKMVLSAYDGNIKYRLKIATKDGRFKVDVFNFYHRNKPGNAPRCQVGLITDAEECDDKSMNKRSSNKVWLDIKEKVEKNSLVIFTDIEKHIKKAVASKNEDDNW